jgi:hypothetical protein
VNRLGSASESGGPGFKTDAEDRSMDYQVKEPAKQPQQRKFRPWLRKWEEIWGKVSHGRSKDSPMLHVGVLTVIEIDPLLLVAGTV